MQPEPARLTGRPGDRARTLRPAGTLARVRAAFLLFGLLTHLVMVAAVVATSGYALADRALAAAALLSLQVWWVLGYLRGGFPAALEPIEVLVVLLACVWLPHVSFGGAILYVAMGFRSLYGNGRQAVTRALMYLGIALASLLIARARGELIPHGALLFRVPILLFVGISNHLLKRTLDQQDRVLARERILRDAGMVLTTARDRSAMIESAAQAALALVAELPGARADLLLGNATGFEIVAAAGDGAARVRGIRVAAPEMSTQIRAAIADGTTLYHERFGDEAPPNAAALARGALLMVPVRGPDGATGALSVMSRAPIPADVRSALETLATQIAMGLESATLTEEPTRQALHDSLTGLANRRLLSARVQQAMSHQGRSGGGLGMLLIDLDGFKKVNDTLGHDAGDEVLIAVAAAIGSAIRGGDTLGRLGGDEFAVVLEDVKDADGARAAAARVLRALAAPVRVRDQEVLVHASVGVAMASVDVNEPGDLFRNADVAMYRAKADGGGVALYEPTMRAGGLERLALESALRAALDRRELTLHYQPVVQLGVDGEIVGVEALVRWTHKKRPVPPSEFIPIAEECGLIQELGAWVLEEACRQAQAWRARLPPERRFTVSVNVSPRQVRPAFLETLERVLRETGLPPGNLALEVTERLLMSDRESSTTLAGIKKLGVKLAIDDFGTGFSSLGYLRRFDIDILKIDRSFIVNVGAAPRATALAEAVVRLGRALDLDTVAESIETAEQAAAMERMGCQMAQGYLFCRPVEAAALEERLFPGERAGAVAGG